MLFFFFFKQKTAYEMRISDWSSDVCSSDLLFGALNYSMRVWLDPDKLTSFQLTPAEVAAAIRTQNIQAAVGRVGAAPLNPDQQLQLTITTQGRLTSQEEFENIIVRANPAGSVVRVRAVPRVARPEEPTSELP